MGIKSLTYLIKNKGTPECITTKKLYEISGKKVAIDASLFIYQSLINIRRGGEPYINQKGELISHIIGIYKKTLNLLSLDIIPIFIFDGKPPSEKKDIIDKRKKIAQESKLQIETETDINKLNSLKKKTVRLTYEIIDDIKHLLTLMGVSYIHMDGEAEGLASELCKLNYVDYIMTEDMDSLVFGSPFMIRKCIDRTVKIKDSISIFNLKEILISFGMTFEQFVELCILCGCDYCPSIPKIGSITAFKIIKNHGNIDNFIEYNNKYPKYNIPDDYKEKLIISKKLFNIFNNSVNIDKLNINSSDINYTELQKYLKYKVEIQEAVIIQNLEKIKQKYKLDG